MSNWNTRLNLASSNGHDFAFMLEQFKTENKEAE
jgi:hypothetical protein